jgi:hypothetical protein
MIGLMHGSEHQPVDKSVDKVLCAKTAQAGFTSDRDRRDPIQYDNKSGSYKNQQSKETITVIMPPQNA